MQHTLYIHELHKISPSSHNPGYTLTDSQELQLDKTVASTVRSKKATTTPELMTLKRAKKVCGGRSRPEKFPSPSRTPG